MDNVHLHNLANYISQLELTIKRLDKLIKKLEEENFSLRAERDCANGSWK